MLEESENQITVTKGKFKITIIPESEDEKDDAIKIANAIEALEYGEMVNDIINSSR